jgi:uncharacterized repeat protein (TIGR03803 family)
MANRPMLCVARGAGILVCALIFAGIASAQASFATIYNFPGQAGGDSHSSLVADSLGNLYGTSAIEGAGPCDQGCGTVFEVTLQPAGHRKFQILYAFQGGSDGLFPTGNIAVDGAGNIYGTTGGGGSNGAGTIFELIPGTGGAWTKQLLYAFPGNRNVQPQGVIWGGAGTLYGTTAYGGAQNNGSVFQLMQNPDGTWSENDLYSFLGNGVDGVAPLAVVTQDSVGDLYGTTSGGGVHTTGTVFKLHRTAEGVWMEKILYTFPKAAFGEPQAPVWLDAWGRVYGTTCGITGNRGMVFELVNAAGFWTEKTLHEFGESGDGGCARSGLTPDSAGNLYGTTFWGGSGAAGTVYKMERGVNGTWSEKILYNFTGLADGQGPSSGVIIGKGNILYGTDGLGGAHQNGVIYQLTP